MDIVTTFICMSRENIVYVMESDYEVKALLHEPNKCIWILIYVNKLLQVLLGRSHSFAHYSVTTINTQGEVSDTDCLVNIEEVFHLVVHARY